MSPDLWLITELINFLEGKAVIKPQNYTCTISTCGLCNNVTDNQQNVYKKSYKSEQLIDK